MSVIKLWVPCKGNFCVADEDRRSFLGAFQQNLQTIWNLPNKEWGKKRVKSSAQPLLRQNFSWAPGDFCLREAPCLSFFFSPWRGTTAVFHVGNPPCCVFYTPQLLQPCWSVSCSEETLISSPVGSSVQPDVSPIYHTWAERARGDMPWLLKHSSSLLHSTHWISEHEAPVHPWFQMLMFKEAERTLIKHKTG